MCLSTLNRRFGTHRPKSKPIQTIPNKSNLLQPPLAYTPVVWLWGKDPISKRARDLAGSQGMPMKECDE